jgi:hypothetical protein
MNKIYHVLVTYATCRLLMLMVFLVSVLGIFMIYAADSGNLGNGSSDMRPLILSSLFPIAILHINLGVFLKQQMATHRAALVPGYRTPHLIAAALVVLFPMAVVTVTAVASSVPLPGIIGLMAFAAMAGIYGGNGSHLVIWPCYAILMATLLVPHLRAAVLEMLNGQQPGMAWSLISAAMAGAALLFHRLATLAEDDPEFGKVIPMNPWDLSAAASRTRNRNRLQHQARFKNFLTAPASQRLDRITIRPATTLWQRVALLRLADDTPVNLVWFAFVMGMAIVIMSLPLSSPNGLQQVFVFLLSPVTAIAWMVPLSATVSRGSRLGYESLRPQTRRQWVIENGLSIIINGMTVHLSIIALSLIVAISLLGKELSAQLVVCGLPFVLSRQILIFGLWFWVASFRSTVMHAIGAIGLISILTPSIIAFPYPSLGWWTIQSLLILSGIVASIGLALCWMAYRRWCRIDLA